MLQKNSKDIESAVLFETKEQALNSLTLSEHISRLTEMRDFLNECLANNRSNLSGLKSVSYQRTAELKNQYERLQSLTGQELEGMKTKFEPAMGAEKKLLASIKNEVTKINSEQLSIKKAAISCEALIEHCENQMGFLQIKKQ